jgi:hypothetical protein
MYPATIRDVIKYDINIKYETLITLKIKYIKIVDYKKKTNF